MEVRFLIDRDTDEPHIAAHGVTAWEVMDVLRKPELDYNGREGTRIAIGQTRNGRYLRIIYRRDESDDSQIVITAYDLPPKAKAALRRHRRRK
jgi:hypothetical protein